jgi:hypothetical protein
MREKTNLSTQQICCKKFKVPLKYRIALLGIDPAVARILLVGRMLKGWADII